MSDVLSGAAHELADQVAAAAEQPAPQRTAQQHQAIRTAYEAAMRATVDAATAQPQDLAELAETVRTALPEPVEDALGPRVRIFVRLLRRDALQPAWMLAADNAAGVIPAGTTTSMWAGPALQRQPLPLPTLVEDCTVYAWVPGFRDPRWSVADDVFDLSAEVELRCSLDRVEFRSEVLLLAGTAALTLLPPSADDTVLLRLDDGDRTRKVSGLRTRQSGWQVRLDLDGLLSGPGDWRLRLVLDHADVRRAEPLGLRRGELARQEFIDAPVELRRGLVRFDQQSHGELVLQARPFDGALARALPVGARAAARRVRPDAFSAPPW